LDRLALCDGLSDLAVIAVRPDSSKASSTGIPELDSLLAAFQDAEMPASVSFIKRFLFTGCILTYQCRATSVTSTLK
ncbi:MAG: hypothetical protein JRC99_10500, partial [Deltaproteobacteria bacterium]|nr:hypothetical protein [Deltaproteobacteria bacterium]